MTFLCGTTDDPLDRAEHAVDRAVRNVAHGRFERALAGLTAMSAVVTGAEVYLEHQSVVDADHRTWDVPNVVVADGSVCPTQGAANPALTIMALSSRLALRLAARAPANADPEPTGGR
jgi:choline dehydrogenase-like flavoprotein